MKLVIYQDTDLLSCEKATQFQSAAQSKYNINLLYTFIVYYVTSSFKKRIEIKHQVHIMHDSKVT